MRKFAMSIAFALFAVACGQEDATAVTETTSQPLAEETAPAKSLAKQPQTQQLASNTAAAAPVKKAPVSNFVEVQYKEGSHYFVLPNPVKTVTGDKIEVAEFFSYGCVHCFHFENAALSWKKNLMPAGVEFVQNPAVFNKSWEHYARAFYAAKSLGIFEQAHKTIFESIHIGRKRLASVDEMASLFETFGIDKETFKKTYSSFGVTSQVQLSDARARGSQLRGTPELMVDGRYRITTGSAGNHENMFLVANFLIEKIKRERGL